MNRRFAIRLAALCLLPAVLTMTACGESKQRPVIVKPDAGQLADPSRCPDEPPMPDAVFADDKEGTIWDSRVRDAGKQCRAAFRALVEFVK